MPAVCSSGQVGGRAARCAGAAAAPVGAAAGPVLGPRPAVVHVACAPAAGSCHAICTEVHGSLGLTTLAPCAPPPASPGAADPVAMREFVVAVHARAGEAGSAGRLTKRAQVLLELVVDVKNNRQAQRGGGGVPGVAPAGCAHACWKMGPGDGGKEVGAGGGQTGAAIACDGLGQSPAALPARSREQARSSRAQPSSCAPCSPPAGGARTRSAAWWSWAQPWASGSRPAAPQTWPLAASPGARCCSPTRRWGSGCSPALEVTCR